MSAALASPTRQASTPESQYEKDVDNEKGSVVSHEVEVQELTGAEFYDPNLDKDALVYEDDSPYPEVRSAVANTDDPDMPVNTIRMWTLGVIVSILIPGINQFFFFRYPSVKITGIVAQLIVFPFGRLWARVLPNISIFGAPLNPGPFNIKEHVLITIMASVGANSAYATDIIAVQRYYYKEVYNFGYQWLLTMSTQLIGFAIGGICRRFLVDPPSMIWPSNLVQCTLFNTLHHQQYSGMGDREGMNRERFFLYCFAGGFAWYFLPGYLFTALSTFSWVCWIAPNNAVVNQLFGYETGLGMSLITFDWSQIAYIGSPLATPWWAEANVTAGFVFFFWVLTPIIYYTNTWYTGFLPVSTRTSYDNTGAEYNVTRILTPEKTFNRTAYEEYSPLYLSATFALTYGLSFAAMTSLFTHTLLYFRKQIWVQARKSLKEQPDIHARLMSRYPQVPAWWYASVFAVMFTFGVIVIEVWHTDLPVWAFVLALLISFTLSVPIGMIQAITNQQFGLNVITEFIIGYALPGRPIAMMMFKTWGYITMYQAMWFAQDFKLGHYMKVPPKPMFLAQVVAATIALTVQLGVQSWMFANINGMCSTHQKDDFICASTQVFGTASIIWGVIGPGLQFSKGQLYYPLLFFFLIGAALPVLSWALMKRWPNKWFKYINFPVIFIGTGYIPPATAINYVPWGIVGFIFQYCIRRRHFSWWSKYNYVLSAAMDSGLAIAVILIFFCLQFPKNGDIGVNTLQKWWGNTVYTNTLDYKGTAVLKHLTPENPTFGPTN